MVVYGGKELTDVAFEDPNGAGVIFRYFVGILPELIHCLVRALPHAAGAGVRDELSVEIRVQNPIERMMKQAVAYTGFVDIAGLGVGDFEVVVATMTVGLTY